MSKSRIQKVAAALLAALLLTSSLATLVSAAAPNAPIAQAVRSRQVKGLLPGGQFANIWLGLQPDTPSANVTVVAEWDRPDASSNGLGFWILDQHSLPRVGEEAFSTIATAAGSSTFILDNPSNMQGAGLTVAGLTPYTIVIYNDSNADANFTLTATNAFITDDSNKVTDPNAAVATSTSITGTVAAAPAASTVVTATATPAPVATTATTTTAATAVTTTTTTAPAATTATTATTSGEVRATTMQGDLPTQDSQHFLGLAPTQRDGEITLRLTFDPQDSTELARRLNFWVLDENGLTQFLRGTSPGELAIAAGNRTFLGESNERVASFKAVGLGTYTVIVYNNSSVPGSYTLTVEGGILSDGSRQTKTALAAPVGATGTVTTTTTTTVTTGATTGTVAATTAVTGTTPAAAPAAGTTAAREGQPGGNYTVKSGDTVALIARDLYGDYRLYQQICTFNGIANCDLIEVGDVIRLPTTAQIQSGATAPAATPTRAAQPAASSAVTSTTAVTTTTPITRSSAVTTTRPVTTTSPATTTRTTTSTAATTAPAASRATTSTATTSAGTIVDALVADGRYTSLVEALQATGLDSVLRGAGPFTVFAPTDAAFAALPAGAFEQLLGDPSGQLTEILRYHVVSGSTLSEDLSNNMQATTTQGKTVRFEGQGTAWKINGANMIERDIEASNGVIHVIDAVILPPPE